MTDIGRPTDYSAQAQAMADEYVTGGYEIAGDVIPSVVGLARILGKPSKTLYAWAERNADFRNTLDVCKDSQHRIALNHGLSGVFNATITKLVLANHGYSDRQAVDHTTGGQPMQSMQDAVLRALQAKHDPE